MALHIIRTVYLLPASLAVALASGCAARQPRPLGLEEELAEPATPAASEVVPSHRAPVATKEPRRATGSIRRAELNAVLDGAPGRFLQHVDTEPRFVGGRFRGWRLASFFPGDARFTGVDLQAGDVVLTVNGQSIERPDQLMRIWEALRVEPALVVAIERDGQARQLRFEIRD